MDKAQIPSDSERYTPSPGPFTFYSYSCGYISLQQISEPLLSLQRLVQFTIFGATYVDVRVKIGKMLHRVPCP
jgi:hypothetical protein